MHRSIGISQLVPVIPELASADSRLLARVEIDGKRSPLLPIHAFQCIESNSPLGIYRQHLRRQERDVRMFMQDEALLLDARLDYSTIEGLSSEVRERLTAVKPATIVCADFRTALSDQKC